MNEFVPFPKIPRLSREIVVTEKIDGTNGCIMVQRFTNGDQYLPSAIATVEGVMYRITPGSRSRWICPGDDNHGFAKWVYDHAVELCGLGEGSHFGEWWGSDIQRGYGLTNGDKRFSLFNTGRWEALDSDADRRLEGQRFAPHCCGVVPVLYRGPMSTEIVNDAVGGLQRHGSKAAPGFMDPEGVIVYHTAANSYFKKTIDRDEVWKGKAA